MKLNIHKIQCVLKPEMNPEQIKGLDIIKIEKRGSLSTLTVRGNRQEVEEKMASYEPVFFEMIPDKTTYKTVSYTHLIGERGKIRTS